jgi:hypothetical protein
MGTFAGLSERNKEFHAQIVVPYKAVPARVPLHGQFVLVQLESDDELGPNHDRGKRGQAHLV